MTDTTDIVFNYCERLSDGFWAEPANAITNLAFLLAAVLLIPPLMISTRVSLLKAVDIVLLISLLFAIGIGSFLWHTLATLWAGWADVIPIVLFISLYLLSFLFRVTGLSILHILICLVLFHLFNSGLQSFIPPDTLNGSIFYLPTLLALIMIGIYTRHTRHPTANRMLTAVMLFAISIVFRSIDFAICHLWATGTHFVWHMINAYVLYSLGMALIETMRLDGDSCEDHLAGNTRPNK